MENELAAAVTRRVAMQAAAARLQATIPLRPPAVVPWVKHLLACGRCATEREDGGVEPSPRRYLCPAGTDLLDTFLDEGT